MPKYAQLVMGPAGSGKSTYCSGLVRHCEAVKRTVHVVNLDPAAEYFNYEALADIRDLIHVDDAMEDETLHFGPNGGLVFCMEYFVQNLDWLEEQLDVVDDDYIIFDCPGQIELYTHIPVMRQFIDQLQRWDYRVCGIFLIDSQFLVQPSKFVSGILAALSAMVTLEIPHVNVMTKLDLLSKKDKKGLEKYLEPDLHSLLSEEFHSPTSNKKFEKLNSAMASLVEDYSLVKFMPLDQTEEESFNDLLLHIDNAIQYGEDLDVKVKDLDDPEQEDLQENYSPFDS